MLTKTPVQNQAASGLHRKERESPPPHNVQRGAYERLLPAGRVALPGEEQPGAAGFFALPELSPRPPAKQGAGGLQPSAAAAIYRGTSPFPARQLSPTGHVRGSENGSFSVIKAKRGAGRGGGGSLREDSGGSGRRWSPRVGQGPAAPGEAGGGRGPRLRAPPHGPCSPQVGRVDGIKTAPGTQNREGGEKTTSASRLILGVWMDSPGSYIGKRWQGAWLLEGIDLKFAGREEEEKYFPGSFFRRN